MDRLLADHGRVTLPFFSALALTIRTEQEEIVTPYGMPSLDQAADLPGPHLWVPEVARYLNQRLDVLALVDHEIDLRPVWILSMKKAELAAKLPPLQGDGNP